MVRQLEEWGYEVNLYAVPDHESFLQAVLLCPARLPPTSTSRSGTTTGGAPASGGATIASRAANQLLLPEQPQIPVRRGLDNVSAGHAT
jgi:hypothetical protein